MLKESISARGNVHFQLISEDGTSKDFGKHNLVVNSGLAFIASRLVGTAQQPVSHVAIGTGTTVASGGQTSLVSELARVALTSSTVVTTTVTNDSVQYVATFGPGAGTGPITEAALLNSVTSGTMVARTAFPVINKGAGDSLVITWKLALT